MAFLRTRAPFDRLDPPTLAALARSLEIIYVPAGAQVLERGGPPATHPFLVRSGSMRLEAAVPARLSAARARVGLPPHDAHDAFADAVATAELLLVLAYRLRARTLADLL